MCVCARAPAKMPVFRLIIFKIDSNSSEIPREHLWDVDTRPRTRDNAQRARRWDLFHTMGATKYAISFGFLMGLILKIICSYFGFSYLAIQPRDIILWSIMVVITVSLLLLFDKGMDRIILEHEEMAYLLITQIDKWKIRKIKRKLGDFSNLYFAN